MCSKRTFPLVSGFLSIDLVNTEVISHGRRHELMVHEQDLLDWLHTMYEQIPSLDREILNISRDEATSLLRSIVQQFAAPGAACVFDIVNGFFKSMPYRRRL